MATLTRYKSFKSLKQGSAKKVKKSAVKKSKVTAEVEAFFQSLKKAKANLNKA